MSAVRIGVVGADGAGSGGVGGDGDAADAASDDRAEGLDAVEAAVRRAGADPVADGPVDVVVAYGTGALQSMVPHPRAPVLPVDAGPGVDSVSRDGLDAALEAVVAGDYDTVEHPVLAVDAPTERRHVLYDLMLVTAEPAHISEFSVFSGDERLARFRADGVVCATPAGSYGYARGAGSPLLQPETDVVAVLPIAPFAIGSDHWVLAVDDVSLAVERNESPVELLCDDHRAGIVARDDPLRIEVVDRLTTISVKPE